MRYNIPHLEDLVLFGHDEAMSVCNILESLITGKDIDITVKWDGAPAFIYGPHPENGKPFITTKNRLLSKEPQVFQSIEEIQSTQNMRRIADTFSALFSHLQELDIDRILQGDLIFDLETKRIGQHYIKFKQNLIEYEVPFVTERGKKILKADVGVVFHSSWSGDTLKTLEKKLEPRIGDLGQSHKIYYADASFASPYPIFEPHEMGITNQTVGFISNGIHNANFDLLRTTIRTEWIKYVNEYYRENYETGGNMDEKLNYWDFYNHQADFTENMKMYAKSNRHYICAILNLQIRVSKLKNNIIRKLERDGDFMTMRPEGFVVDDRKGNVVKLMDRSYRRDK